MPSQLALGIDPMFFMLGRRRRRRANIKITLGYCFVLAGEFFHNFTLQIVINISNGLSEHHILKYISNKYIFIVIFPYL